MEEGTGNAAAVPSSIGRKDFQLIFSSHPVCPCPSFSRKNSVCELIVTEDEGPNSEGPLPLTPSSLTVHVSSFRSQSLLSSGEECLSKRNSAFSASSEYETSSDASTSKCTVKARNVVSNPSRGSQLISKYFEKEDDDFEDTTEDESMPSEKELVYADDSGDDENEKYYDLNGNLLNTTTINGNIESDENNEENQSARTRRLFKQFPPSKQEFYDVWKNVRRFPEEYGMNCSVMTTESLEDMYNFYANSDILTQVKSTSSSRATSQSKLGGTPKSPKRNYREIPLSYIPLVPVRGCEHFYNWKPVLDPQIIQTQKCRYDALKAKYPHLPLLSDDDFRFNPATVRRYIRKAEEWDALVRGKNADLKRRQWTKVAPKGLGSRRFSKSPALFSCKTSFLKEGTYQSIYQRSGAASTTWTNKFPSDPWIYTSSQNSSTTKGLIHPKHLMARTMKSQESRFKTEYNFLQAGTISPGRLPSPVKLNPFNLDNNFERAKVKVRNGMVRERYEQELHKLVKGKKPHEIIRLLVPRCNLDGTHIN